MAEQSTADEDLPIIARFEVRRRAYLAADGTLRHLSVYGGLPGWRSSSDAGRKRL
jgi:hypothetical protein